MSLSTDSHVIGNVAVVRLCGRLSVLEGTMLGEEVRSLIGRGARRIVFNLAELTYIDSFGLGQLVTVYTTAGTKGCRVKLAKPNEMVRRLLQITKLDTVLEILGDESPAILRLAS